MTGIFEINFAATLLILVILAIRGLFKNKLPKRFFAWIWAVVLLRLIVPFSVPVQISALPSDFTIPVIDKMNGTSVAAGNFGDDGEFNYFYDFTPEQAEQVRDFNSKLAVISVGITLLLAALFIAVHLRCRKRYADALPFENEQAEQFIKSYGLKRAVKLRYSDRISAPITYGIINPVIVLPKLCADEGFESLESILAHELAHIRCFDVLYKWIITAVTCLYWYNPFVWLMFVVSDRDIEVACDVEAIEKSGCTNEIYSGQLIALEEKRSLDIYARSFSSGAIKSRIRLIMKAKKTGIASVVIAAVLSVCSFTVFASAHTCVNSENYSLFVPTYYHTDSVSELLWLEPQRYYLEGGTKEQYIEIFEDKTLQIFGLDYVGYTLEESAEYYAALTEEEMEYELSVLEEIEERYSRRSRYELLQPVGCISVYKEDGEIAFFIHYDDENTFKLNGISMTYKAERPWKAGIYQAYDEDRVPGLGYYYSDIDNSYLYVCYDALEKFDGDGNRSGPVRYVQVKRDDRPGEIIFATNADRLPAEEPAGYILGEDNNSLYDPVSGATYTLKSKPVLS